MNASGESDFLAHAVSRKTARGAINLGIRQVLVQGSNILGSIVLARLLSPNDFGVYAVIVFASNFLAAFGAGGLAASLIRQSEEPTEMDYRTVFTVQQVLVCAVVALTFVCSPLLANAYGLSSQSSWLFRLTSLSLVAVSLMVVPQARLERHLQFDRLAMIEVPQAVLFNVTAISLAYWRFGAFSFPIALLVRTISGAVLANIISPWSIGFAWDWQRIKEHLRFGLPFQGIQLISLVKDSITPLLVGLSVGPVAVGYLNWAGTLATYPVLALFVLQRLYMPAMSRLQNQPSELALFTNNVLWLTNLLTAPLAVLTLVLVTPITIIVFGEKWRPAISYFYLLWAANVFVPISIPVMSLLNSLGHSQMAFRFSIIWMVGTWAIGAPLIFICGPLGFAIANLIVQFTNIFLVRIAQRKIPFSVLANICRSWSVASLVGLCVWALNWAYPVKSAVALITFIFGSLAIYAVSIFVVDRGLILASLKTYRNR